MLHLLSKLDTLKIMRKNLAIQKLQNFLEETGTSKTQFAKKLGIGKVSFSRYFSGERMPDDAMKVRIFELTKSVTPVTPNDWCGVRVADDVQ